MPDHIAGDIFTAAMWTDYIEANINKLLYRGHRVLTAAAFLALTGLEDGDEAYVEVDATNGLIWPLRYHLSSTKWRVFGGMPMFAEVTTSETTTSTTYVDLATVGPSVTVPLLGDYEIVEGMNGRNADSAQGGVAAVKLGAAATADAEAVYTGGNSGSAHFFGVSRPLRRAAVAASTVLKLQYKITGGAGPLTAKDRRLSVMPTRIG